MLEAFTTLVDQCVKGEGLVQVNAQILDTTKRINIADVVKPTEEVAMKNEESVVATDIDMNNIAHATNSNNSSDGMLMLTLFNCECIQFFQRYSDFSF